MHLPAHFLLGTISPGTIINFPKSPGQEPLFGSAPVFGSKEYGRWNSTNHWYIVSAPQSKENSQTNYITFLKSYLSCWLSGLCKISKLK